MTVRIQKTSPVPDVTHAPRSSTLKRVATRGAIAASAAATTPAKRAKLTAAMIAAGKVSATIRHGVARASTAYGQKNRYGTIGAGIVRGALVERDDGPRERIDPRGRAERRALLAGLGGAG